MNRPFLAWPGWPFLRFASVPAAANAVWFVLVYGGCDWVTAHRSLRMRIHLPGELSIPLIPGAVVFYMSIYALFLAGPFVVRERRKFAALIGALALSTLIGGVCFLLVPARPAFPPPGDLGMWSGLFHFADALNLDYNMAPSLHVAFSVCCVAAFAPQASPPGRALLWAWAGVIAVSTVLTHQHHLVDVVTGWATGIAATRLSASLESVDGELNAETQSRRGRRG